MKELWHSRTFLWVFFGMLIAILGLLCVILVDGTGDERRRESESMVEREEMLTEADRLLQAMERGNTVLSVHYALSAGKAAANCGLREESAMFSAIGDALMGGGKLEEAAETVRAFLRDGSLPVKESETSSEKTEPPVDKTVSVMREARAKESADRFFGLSGTWRGGEGTNTLIYSCTNGYAVMDARNGMPVEGAISLPPVGDIRYSAEECVVRGMQFLRQFYSTGTVDSLAVEGVQEDGRNGTFHIRLRGLGRTISLAVRRDSGRVVWMKDEKGA